MKDVVLVLRCSPSSASACSTCAPAIASWGPTTPTRTDAAAEDVRTDGCRAGDRREHRRARPRCCSPSTWSPPSSSPRGSDDVVRPGLQLIAFIAAARRHRAPARPLHGARLRRAAPCRLDRVFGPVERLIYRVVPHRPRARAAVERLRALAARVQHRRRSVLVRACSGSRPGCRSTPRHGERRARRWRSTPRSASSRTRTGRATPRDDDEPPHPDGGAHRPELRLRGRRAWR